eukprot:626687-Pleurochrysis_carterae.AAC.3
MISIGGRTFAVCFASSLRMRMRCRLKRRICVTAGRTLGSLVEHGVSLCEASEASVHELVDARREQPLPVMHHIGHLLSPPRADARAVEEPDQRDEQRARHLQAQACAVHEDMGTANAVYLQSQVQNSIPSKTSSHQIASTWNV